MTARVIPFQRLDLPVPAPSREAMLDEIAIVRDCLPDLPATRAAYVAGFMAGFLKGACPTQETR
ncbi:MAG: hypothetical protein ACOZB0_04665 [Pseudomonadota bacterium]